MPPSLAERLRKAGIRHYEMNRIILVVIMVLISLVAGQAQEVPYRTMKIGLTGMEKTKVARLESAPLESLNNYGELVKKEPKFEVAVGIGNGFNKMGLKAWGGYGRYDNSPALSVRFGYSPWKYIELQGEYFSTRFYKKTTWGEANEGFNSYGLNIKFKAPLSIIGVKFSPYVIAGTGKTKNTYYGVDGGMKFKYSGPGKYTKIGGGVELNLYKNVLLFSELNYLKTGLINYHYVWGGSEWTMENNFYFSTIIGGIGIRF